jgi:hypothetical protein
MVVMKLVAAGAAAAILSFPSGARAGDVSVLVVPPFAPERYAGRGAVGLLVPGAGAHVSRASALAALVRGKVRNSTVGGLPTGPPTFTVGARPAETTIYVSLPPPGRHENRTRYGIAIVGPGYRGVLLSSRTKIPGLVSVADVAPTVEAMRCECGDEPTLTARADGDAPDTLRALDKRFARLHGSRLAARLVLVGVALALAAAALASGSILLARAAVLAPPLALAGALALSALELDSWLPATLVLAGLAGPGALAAARVLSTPRRLGVAFALALAALLVVLVSWPQVPALAALGPHPDGGGRFYGITNSVETVLLVPAILAGLLLPARVLLGVALLALVTVGWSRAGADGGGIIVLAAAFLALWLRRRGEPLTARRIVVGAALVVAAGLALVAIDAITGGSSHVTRAVSGGPLALLGDLAHRVNYSFHSATSTWLTALGVAAWIAGTIALLVRGPRTPAVVALAVALLASLIVNDAPKDVSLLGFVACAGLVAWERVRADARRTA